MTIQQRSEGEQQLEFRRVVVPLPTGRVRVSLEVRRAGVRRLLGRIVQVRGGWQYRAADGKVGAIFRTAAECRQAISREAEEWK
jgi:hypothetical protein